MTTYLVTLKATCAEVYRYQSDAPVEWNGMEFVTHAHTAVVEVVEPPAPAVVQVWTRIEFLRRFTAPERIAIRSAAKVNADLDDFMFLLEAASEVHSDNADVAGGLALLEAAHLIGAGRAQEILNG